VNKKEINKLVQLRNHSIKFYSNLDAKESSTSLMNTKQCAYFCEEIIKSIDEILKEYVKFS